jgi:hypothetical protein
VVVTGAFGFFRNLIKLGQMLEECAFFNNIGNPVIETGVALIIGNIQALQSKIGVNANKQCVEPADNSQNSIG